MINEIDYTGEAVLADQRDVVLKSELLTTATKLLVNADASGETIWVTSYTDSDLTGKVHKIGADGVVKHTFSLPKPLNSRHSTQAADLKTVGNNLWITDYNYGRLYRYDTTKNVSEAELFCEVFSTGEKAVQFGGITCQESPVKRLWFTDFEEAKLLAIDLTKPAMSPPALNFYFDIDPAKFSAKDIIFTPENKKLWVLMVGKKISDRNELWCVDVSTVPSSTVKAAHSWVIPDASAMHLFGKSLYISAASGRFFKVEDATANTTAEPVIWRAQELPEAAHINAFTMDGAGYIIALNNDNNGQLYHLDKQGRLHARYKMAEMKGAIAPGDILWRKKSISPALPEQLFITDELNARVMTVKLPDRLDPNNNAEYDIVAKPNRNDDLHQGGTTEIAIHATENIHQNDVAMPVRLVISDMAPGVSALFSNNRVDLPVFTTSDLKSPIKVKVNIGKGSSDGIFNIRAFGRGLSSQGKVIYTGTVQTIIESVTLTPANFGMAYQHEQAFQVNGHSVSITLKVLPEKANVPVKVALDGPGFFADDHSKLKTVHHGESFTVHSGDEVGLVKVQATAAGKTSNVITGQVAPWPAKCIAPQDITIHRIGGKLDGLVYKLLGYQTWHTANKLIPLIVPWQMTLSTDDSRVVFKNGVNTSATIKVHTDNEGVLNLDSLGYSIVNSHGLTEFRITYAIATLVEGKEPMPEALVGSTTVTVD